MKATEQYFPVVLFIMLSFGSLIILYEVVLSLIIWMRSTEQYFPVVQTVYYDEQAGFNI